MKLRLTVYVDRSLMVQLTECAKRRRQSKSQVANAAFESFLTPADADRQETATTRRLDQLNRQIEQLDRNLHICVEALVYIRQSTPDQLMHNRESQRRQYGLADRAKQLGWAAVEIIDDDLGRSGGGIARPGFHRMPQYRGGAQRCLAAATLQHRSQYPDQPRLWWSVCLRANNEQGQRRGGP